MIFFCFFFQSLLGEEAHPLSQSSGLVILCVLSVAINIYFLARLYYKTRKNNLDRKSKKSRCKCDVDGSSNTPEPSSPRSVENVDPNENDQELNRIDVESAVESAVVKQEITNEQDDQDKMR